MSDNVILVRAALAFLGVVAGIAVACSAPTIGGSDIGGDNPLPSRGDDDDDNTAPAPTASATQAPPTINAPTTDASLPTTSTTCSVANTALCFTFDGNTTNQSTDGLQPSVASGIAYAAGHENEAAFFNAASALQFTANSALELPAGAATIEAWINRQATGGDAVVFDDDGRFSLTIQANGTMICKSSGGSVAGSTIVTTNAWNHVACVLDGTTLSAYLNGTLEKSGTGSIKSNPTLTASIGANAPPGSSDGDQIFLGLIDSFRVFTVARAASDIATDAASP